jgi:hypothetical protein
MKSRVKVAVGRCDHCQNIHLMIFQEGEAIISEPLSDKEWADLQLVVAVAQREREKERGAANAQ